MINLFAGRRFNSLRLNPIIPLYDGGGAMLQKPLDQGNVIAIVLVDLCSVPFAEAVGADSRKTRDSPLSYRAVRDSNPCEACRSATCFAA